MKIYHKYLLDNNMVQEKSIRLEIICILLKGVLLDEIIREGIMSSTLNL